MPSELATDTAGPLAVEVYRRVSEVVTLAAAICEAEGIALTEVQVGCLTQAAVHACDGVQDAFASMLSVESELRAGTFALRAGDGLDGPHDGEAGR